MPDNRDYMKFSQECLELAKTASAAHRPILLQMADTWRLLALEAETRKQGRQGNEPGGPP
jgi:hypothetical protein